MSTPTDPSTPPAAEPEPAAPPADPAAPPATGEGDAPLGPAGEKALAEWKTRAKEAEKTAREQAARLKEFEDAQKTEAERLADSLKAAESRAEAATRLAVASKVEALASGRFADPQDAVDALKDGQFVGDDGAIRADAIEEALAGLLERKPHWARSEQGPRTPAPDPSQGARPGGVQTLDQRISEAEAKGDTRLALALKTQKLREISKTK